MMRGAITLLIVSLIFVAAPAQALRSTKVEGHTDPDFIGYTPKNVVLSVIGADTGMRLQIEERMTKTMAGFGVVVFTERSLFPPTRAWTPEARTEIMARRGIDSSLTLAVGASSAEIIPIAQQTFGSANTYGQVRHNGAFNATTQGQATTYNVISARSTAEFSAVLVDAVSGKTVWFGDVVTKAGGTLFVGARGDAKASVKGVVEGLMEDGHIAKQAGRR